MALRRGPEIESRREPVLEDRRREKDISYCIRFIDAGTTTIGTQAAVEYLCQQNSLEQLLLRLSVSNSGEVKPFEAVIRVKVVKGAHNCNISSGKIRAALQGGPIVIIGLGCPLRLSFLLLFCPCTQARLTGSIVLHLASKHDVAQPLLHTVKF